ncbi:bacterio-opsin activator domain-containing protein [Halobaculum marinum]|uniref:Bacterio-opsin activator domain-containing protein n=1 Tax=Halobaculum marinum TaxID=3031996 RepID=A0ABD5WT89_9EURY|nr:bacterio-opsin activator domain-containing protein [Halobaculum sp. DT55]
MTTPEVADRLGVGRRTVYARLERLADAGRVETKKVGAGGRVWWRPVDRDGPSESEGSEFDPGATKRQYRTVLEHFPNGAIALVDQDLRYTSFGGTPEGDADVTRHDLVGEPLREGLPPSLGQVVIPGYERALDGETATYEATVDDAVYQFHFYPVRDDDGTVIEALGMSQEVTARTRYHEQLEARLRQQEAVAALGQRALDYDDLDDLFAEATRLVADVLDDDYCKVLDLHSEREELLLREGVGWDDGIVGSATVSAVENDSQAAHTLATEGPVIVEDLHEETRFSGPDLLTSHDVRSGISTIIGSVESPWGILGVHDTEPAELSDHDAAFVQSVANVLASSIERWHHEREIGRNRRQLTALNSVNRVVRQITEAVIDRSTREAIESATCERLAVSESYDFAWVGVADAASKEIRVRAESGGDGYLEDTRITVDPDDERGNGPAGRAYRTGEIQFTHDAATDPQMEPWREQFDEHGWRSAATIPIVHGETVYGVLAVYTERAEAFVGHEREVIGNLGEVVGHAIASVERKRALLSDEVVELEFLVEDVFGPTGIDAPADPVHIHNAVPLDDSEYLVFGRTTATGVETFEMLVDTHPQYDRLAVQSDGDDRRFEVAVSDLPVLSTLAAMGGAIERAVIEDGDFRVTIQLSPTTDARQLIGAMRETYPGVSLLRREQVSRVNEGVDAAIPALTDRQQTALVTAYHAGYFSWPRDATAEEVATALDIAAPTLHQHLRKGQQKVFDAVFDDRDPDPVDVPER